MSTQTDSNVIVIPIEISLEDKAEWAAIHKQIQEDRDILNKAGKPADSEGTIIASGNLQDLDAGETGGLGISRREVLSAARSGLGGAEAIEALIVSRMTYLVPIIGEVMIAAGIVGKMFEWYYSPGAPGDVRFKRDVTKENDLFLSRQEQQNRRIGRTQVIITSINGFRNLNGANVGNTLEQVRTFGVSKIGLRDKAGGWLP